MKEFFFCQLPEGKLIKGWRGRWKQVSELSNCDEGPIITSFDKSKVFYLADKEACEIDELELISRKSCSIEAEMSREDYVNLVNQTQDYCSIHTGKIVISRIKKHKLPEGFKPDVFFSALCDLYSHSFNYLLFSEELGLWIGVSPEKLVEGSMGKFAVVALAGSRSVDNPFDWTKKEIVEQQMVTNQIEADLEALGLKHNQSETYTAKAANLEHLRTDFTIETENPLGLADKLHPTPAVSGFPKEEAIDFILSHESHDRSLYSGIVGYQIGGQTKLFVNLRCAQIFDNSMDLYVGGGITGESNSNDEWEETEIKSKTLLSVIEKM